MNIGNVIRNLRNEQNLSQKKLADSIGVSQSTIAQIEKNRNEATASTIRKLAIFFGVSASYLLELEDDFGTAVIQPSSETLTKEERDIINNYRELNFAGKKLIKQTLNTLIESTSSSGHSIKKFGSDKNG